MAREMTIRTLSGNELKNVTGGANVPSIRLNPPARSSEVTGENLEHESGEGEGVKG
jgi:hypothetical protein